MFNLNLFRESKIFFPIGNSKKFKNMILLFFQNLIRFAFGTIQVFNAQR